MKSVIIVGAGVIGLTCAVRLARAGARVTVLEAESDDVVIGSPTASVAAAGMIAPFGEEPSPHDALALESFDLWRSAAPGAMWSDGVRFDGGVAITHEPGALMERVKTSGRTATALNAGQFRKRTGLQTKIENAVFIEDEGVADPIRVLTGLAMEARAFGVIVANNQDVMEASATTVKTHEAAVLEADAIVLATGAWAIDALLAAAPALKHVRAGKGHLVQVELSNTLRPNVRAPGFYLSRRRDDVVLGATLEYDRFDRRVDQVQVAQLTAAAETALPGELRPTGRAWAGIRPMSPDGWPLIGSTGSGLLVAAGHSRNGWLLAPITAEIITAYVFGEEISPAWAALSPARFEK